MANPLFPGVFPGNQTSNSNYDYETGQVGTANSVSRSDRGFVRAYDVAWLDQKNRACFDSIVAPATPVVESACSALSRGALVATARGPIAVEDLTPGIEVITREGEALPLKWIGSYEMAGAEAPGKSNEQLFRVTTDTFGQGKPSQDLMLAPRAHILLKHAACRSLFGMDMAFGPIRAFEDGVSVIAVSPVSPVCVYNLAFDRQATIFANGVEVESFHPGPHASTLLDDEMLYSLLRLFPHVASLDDFGPQQIDRLTRFEVGALRDGT